MHTEHEGALNISKVNVIILDAERTLGAPLICVLAWDRFKYACIIDFGHIFPFHRKFTRKIVAFWIRSYR